MRFYKDLTVYIKSKIILTDTIGSAFKSRHQKFRIPTLSRDLQRSRQSEAANASGNALSLRPRQGRLSGETHGALNAYCRMPADELDEVQVEPGDRYTSRPKHACLIAFDRPGRP